MTYQTRALAITPFRYYQSDETTGISAADTSGNSGTGTYTPNNGSAWTGGTLGASAFTGNGVAPTFSGGAIQTAGNWPAGATTAFSWTGWVYLSSTADFRTIFSKFVNTGDRFEISTGAPLNGDLLGLAAVIGGAGIFTAQCLTLNTWIHVAIVFDGSLAAGNRLAAYANGAVVSIATQFGVIPAAAQTTNSESFIGARSGSVQPWAGSIDEVAVYNSALSAAQVLALYGTAATAAVTAATVAVAGNTIAVTMDQASTPGAANFVVKTAGNTVTVTSVAGSGTSFTLTLGRRFIRQSAIVTVTAGGATVSATNNSTVYDAQVRHVGRQFGMFIHFGLETYIPTERSAGNEAINGFAPTQTPEAFIDQWINGAKSAGMKYMTLTSKHHGGFCLWATDTTTRGVKNTSWYAANGQKDIISIFCERVRAAGIGVCLYFSIWDIAYELANGRSNGAAYTAYTQSQLTELLTKYGQIDMLWFDGWDWLGDPVSVPFSTISYASIANHIHGLQPDCLVLNNDHRKSIASSELIMYEVAIDGAIASNNLLPAEAVETMRTNNNWFGGDNSSYLVISSATAISNIETCQSRHGAYMLNSPPIQSGLMPDQAMSLLAGIGAATSESCNRIRTGLRASTVTSTLSTSGVAAANLTGLRWSWWDVPYPSRRGPAASEGTGATTNGSGVITLTVYTRLAAAGIGWLEVTQSDGTVSQSPTPKLASGPAAVT